MANDILNNFFLVVRIIESLFFLVNLHQKKFWRRGQIFQGMVLIVKIIGYVCLYEFFQGYYWQD